MTKKQIKTVAKIWVASILTHHGFEYQEENLSEEDLNHIQDEIRALSVKIGGDLPVFIRTDECIKYVKENIK